MGGDPMMDESLKVAVSKIGAVWGLAKPARKRVLRRLWPDLAYGLDLLEQWCRDRGAL